MPRIFLFVLVILSLIQASLTAKDRSEPLRTPYEIVLEAQTFSIGGVGIAGVRSREEVAFRELLTQKNGHEQFRILVTRATPAGQLYALLGLKLLHDPAYGEAVKRLAASKLEVEMLAGCVGARASSASIASRIDNGALK